jgi:hypothetical protein
MTAQRRRYTKTQKAEAVAVANMTNAKAAAETLRIPRKTLSYWLDDPEYASLRHETRDAVADQFWAAIQVGLKEVANGLRDPDAALRDKSVALGILYDKHALLTGGATARSENRDISGTLSDADVLTALRYADDLARSGGSGTAEAAQGAPEGEGL